MSHSSTAHLEEEKENNFKNEEGKNINHIRRKIEVPLEQEMDDNDDNDDGDRMKLIRKADRRRRGRT